jgi:hypothetical protein
VPALPQGAAVKRGAGIGAERGLMLAQVSALFIHQDTALLLLTAGGEGRRHKDQGKYGFNAAKKSMICHETGPAELCLDAGDLRKKKEVAPWENCGATSLRYQQINRR